MKILVTGAAGFIGYHLCRQLLKIPNISVVGLDNINDYYDINLKYNRLNQLGISKEKSETFNTINNSITNEAFSFVRISLEDKENLVRLFAQENFDVVCNLAAQAGVRYSLRNPDAYIQSNIVGFLNILECCRHHKIKHLVYASSSSVYGANKKIPFETTDNVDHPVSLYAATKKSNELMAYTYSHLYKIQTTGLRFFTVYGPWGRPDMAPILFADAITNNNPIKVFNYGKMKRDFTYIDDIVAGVLKIILQTSTDRELYKVYNIGNSKSVDLLEFISHIETNLGQKAEKNMLPIQPGDVEQTWANVDDLIKDYDYAPNISIEVGIERFIEWYKTIYVK